MGTTERQQDTPVKDKLFREWYSYSFYQAVHLLELLSPEKKRLGESMEPAMEAVRFSVKPGLKFPASDIAGLTADTDERQPAQMDIAFMGLIGPAGVLPHWYNELAIERGVKKDSSMVAFFDLFHHRLISLFFRGWKKHQFPVNFLPGAKDSLSGYLLSLCGLGTDGLAGRIGFAEESLSYYSGLLSRQVPSGTAISSTVQHFSGTDTEITQFVQRLVPLEEADMTRLGTANATLGVDALCGMSIWECQTKFLLSLGPMHFKDFIRFLPCGDMHGPTFSLVRYMVGIEYEFDIEIILKKEEVPPIVLGRTDTGASRLGWTSWLKTPRIDFVQNPSIVFHEAKSVN